MNRILIAIALLALVPAYAEEPAEPEEKAVAEEESSEANGDGIKSPKTMSGMSILGNEETPKSLVIVPWKSSEMGDSIKLSDTLDERAIPVDKENDSSRITFEAQPGRILVNIDRKTMATYVYEDPDILRPYFAALKAPSGVQVTRHHPPRKGLDADDNTTMHPGLWLALGDISGNDFWRNKARVNHVGFINELT